MKTKLFIIFMCVIVLTVGLLNYQPKSVYAEQSVQTCDVYYWDTSILWIVLRNAPVAIDYSTIFYIAEQPDFMPIITATDYGYYRVDNDVYTKVNYSFGSSDWQVSDLSCIAIFSDGSSTTFHNSGTWWQFNTHLSFIR